MWGWGGIIGFREGQSGRGWVCYFCVLVLVEQLEDFVIVFYFGVGAFAGVIVQVFQIQRQGYLCLFIFLCVRMCCRRCRLRFGLGQYSLQLVGRVVGQFGFFGRLGFLGRGEVQQEVVTVVLGSWVCRIGVSWVNGSFVYQF